MIRLQQTNLAHAKTLELQELDDSSLVAQFLGGEKRAFNELVRRYHVRLLNFIYRTIGDRDRAEDLVQETFVRVYRHLHRFDQTKKFSTWAYTIAGNLAKNELRKIELILQRVANEERVRAERVEQRLTDEFAAARVAASEKRRGEA